MSPFPRIHIVRLAASVIGVLLLMAGWPEPASAAPVVHPVEQIENVHGSVALAFVLGVAGGFAGVVVFEALSNQVLPGQASVQTSS